MDKKQQAVKDAAVLKQHILEGQEETRKAPWNQGYREWPRQTPLPLIVPIATIEKWRLDHAELCDRARHLFSPGVPRHCEVAATIANSPPCIMVTLVHIDDQGQASIEDVPCGVLSERVAPWHDELSKLIEGMRSEVALAFLPER